MTSAGAERPVDVCVLGSVNVDLVAVVDRQPDTGETLTGSSFTVVPGGKGANQAVAAARQGARVAFVGATGSDANADIGRHALTEAGVDTTHLGIADAPTGVALITVDADGGNRIVVVPGANGMVDESAVDGAADLLGRAGWLLAQLEVPVAAVHAALVRAREAGTATMLNAAPAKHLDDSVLALVDVLVVNEHELAVIVGDGNVAAAAELRSRGPATVVVTLGAAGAVALDADGTHEIAAKEVDVVDTVGAGDAFCGTLAAALASGLGIAEALERANAAGALATIVPGAIPSLPTKAAVDALLSR